MNAELSSGVTVTVNGVRWHFPFADVDGPSGQVTEVVRSRLDAVIGQIRSAESAGVFLSPAKELS